MGTIQSELKKLKDIFKPLEVSTEARKAFFGNRVWLDNSTELDTCSTEQLEEYLKICNKMEKVNIAYPFNQLDRLENQLNCATLYHSLFNVQKVNVQTYLKSLIKTLEDNLTTIPEAMYDKVSISKIHENLEKKYQNITIKTWINFICSTSIFNWKVYDFVTTPFKLFVRNVPNELKVIDNEQGELLSNYDILKECMLFKDLTDAQKEVLFIEKEIRRFKIWDLPKNLQKVSIYLSLVKYFKTFYRSYFSFWKEYKNILKGILESRDNKSAKEMENDKG